MQMAQQSPLSKSLSVDNSPANPLTLANGFNAAPGITPNTFAIDPDFRVGNAQNWQVSAQMDLPGALVATATYIGIKGTHAVQAFLPNTYPAGAVNPCPSCPSGFTYLTSNGNSTREAGSFSCGGGCTTGSRRPAQYTYSRVHRQRRRWAAAGRARSVIAQNWLDLERRARSFEFRPAAPGDAAVAVHHRAWA